MTTPARTKTHAAKLIALRDAEAAAAASSAAAAAASAAAAAATAERDAGVSAERGAAELGAARLARLRWRLVAQSVTPRRHPLARAPAAEAAAERELHALRTAVRDSEAKA